MPNIATHERNTKAEFLEYRYLSMFSDSLSTPGKKLERDCEKSKISETWNSDQPWSFQRLGGDRIFKSIYILSNWKSSPNTVTLAKPSLEPAALLA